MEELAAGTRCHHFCLERAGLAEYCEMHQRKGVSVSTTTPGMDRSGPTWVTGPDGNHIEPMEYGPFSPQLTG